MYADRTGLKYKLCKAIWFYSEKESISVKTVLIDTEVFQSKAGTFEKTIL